MNGYDLHRQWFDFAFANQGLVTPTHTAMYAWFVELNNRMGWVNQFNCPASQTMAAIGVKHHSTYKKTFDDLVEFGFVKVIEEAKNQWTACVIALSNFDEAHSEALDKAIARHVTEQPKGTYQGTPQGTCDINKPLNLETFKPLNLKTEAREEENPDEVEDSKKKEKKFRRKKKGRGSRNSWSTDSGSYRGFHRAIRRAGRLHSDQNSTPGQKTNGRTDSTSLSETGKLKFKIQYLT